MAADPAEYRRALEALMGTPATDGNSVEVLRNGHEIFPAMLEAIRAAEQTVDLLTYVYWKGAPAEWFADALADRARAGVRVRVLVDAIGGRLMDDEVADRMTEAGVVLERFRPLNEPKMWRNSHRTHRRVLLVDGRVAFTGGVGIAEEWLGDPIEDQAWRDTHVRVTGPAVDGLRAAFLENWAETGQQLIDDDERYPAPQDGGDVPVMIVRSSAGHGVSNMAILKRLLIDLAQDHVHITAAYLAPDAGAVEAIRAACERGVEVSILVPGSNIDKRVSQVAAQEHFEELLDAGARLFTYEPAMLHAKTTVVDDVIADVGSANFNSRSLSQDEEVDLVAFSSEVAAIVEAHFQDDLTHAEEITRERWEARGPVQRLAEAAIGLVDDVM